MNKPKCIVMVGLPASGKSTTAINWYCNSQTFIYSTDKYIEECAEANGWTYDQAFAEFIDPATKRMNEQLEIAIRSKQDIIWDQTNLGSKKRSKIVSRMRQSGYYVICVCINPPEVEDEIVEWNRRLHGRPGKTIPEHIITSMVKNYEPPSIEEGFDEVEYYNINQVLVSAKYAD